MLEQIDRILLPIDLFHKGAWEKATGTAVEMAKDMRCNHLRPWVVPEIELNLAAFPESHQPELGTFIEQTIDPKGIKAMPVLRTGSIYREILAAAEEYDVDLIVIGSHDPRFGDAIMGSTASSVVLHAKRSVYVVR